MYSWKVRLCPPQPSDSTPVQTHPYCQPNTSRAWRQSRSILWRLSAIRHCRPVRSCPRKFSSECESPSDLDMFSLFICSFRNRLDARRLVCVILFHNSLQLWAVRVEPDCVPAVILVWCNPKGHKAPLGQQVVQEQFPANVGFRFFHCSFLLKLILGLSLFLCSGAPYLRFAALRHRRRTQGNTWSGHLSAQIPYRIRRRSSFWISFLASFWFPFKKFLVLIYPYSTLLTRYR